MDSLVTAGASNLLLGGVSNSHAMSPPPPLVPTVSTDDLDLSNRLRDILDVAANVVVADEDDWMRTPTSSEAPLAENDLFSCLYAAVGSFMDLTTDPFEPTPMTEERSKVSWEHPHEKFLPFGFHESPVVRSMVDRSSGL